MTATIVVAVCLMLAVLGKIISKRWFNPATMFSALWCVILFLASLEMYNLKGADNRTYYIMLFGVAAFSMGFCYWYIVRRKKIFSLRFYKKNAGKKEYEINYKLLYLVCCIIIVFNLPIFVSSIILLFRGEGLDEIRYLAQNPVHSASRTIRNVINNLVVAPFSLAILPITAIDVIAGKKDKKLIIFTIIIMLTKLLGDGGRTPVLYFVFHLLVILLLAKRKMDISAAPKTKKILILVAGGAITVFIIASLSRSGGNLKVFTYYYFSMQPTMFEQWAEHISGLRGYGEASLNGVLFPLLYIFKNIFGISYPEHWNAVYDLIQRTDSEWQLIAGEHIKANAYVSLFWFFYLDARAAGVGFMSWLYGMFCGGKFADAVYRPSRKIVCVYSFVVQGLVFSFVRFQFATMAYALGFFYLYFLGFRKERNEQ